MKKTLTLTASLLIGLSTAGFGALVGQFTFEGGSLTDTTGLWNDLELQGDASIINGQLDVNGSGTTATGWAATTGPGDYTGPALGNKTLVSWVALQDANVRAGSALTIDTRTGDVFDGIIWAEQTAGRWMNGSNGFSRTMDFGAGADEPGPFDGSNLIQMAISYEDLGGGNVQITGYRNGVQIGQYTDTPFATWSTPNVELILGKRHGNPLSGVPGALDALIEEVRIYDEVLDANALNAMVPVPEPATTLLGALGVLFLLRRRKR